MTFTHPTTAHIIDAAALVVPATSYLAGIPMEMSATLMGLGIVWYAIQIGEWLGKKHAARKEKHKKKGEVTCG